MITAGQTAPDFNTANQHGELVSLKSILSEQHLVLYFYPKDDTPGCTIEANDFTELADDFAKVNTRVLGVSKDSCASHQDFISKFNLNIDLLSDTSGELCEAYSIWREKEKNGVKKMGIMRSTFLINQQGDVMFAEYGVNPEGHAKTLLAMASDLA